MLTKLSLLLAVLFQAASGAQVVEEKHPNGNIKLRREVIRGRGGAAVNHGTPERKIAIGAGCTIGSGAVVIGDCEPNSVYVGVPARKIR